MQINRRTQFGLNAAIGLFIVLSIGGIARLVWLQNRADSPAIPPEADRAFLAAQHEGYMAEVALDYPHADQAYHAALNMRPERADIKVNLARVLAAEGKGKEAWRLYSDVVDGTWSKGTRPGSADDALAWFADLSLSYGDPKKAERLAKTIVPPLKNGQALTRARLFAKAHLYGAAAMIPLRITPIAHVRRAIELDPSWITPHLTLSRILQDQHQDKSSDTEYAIAKRLAWNGTAKDMLELARFDANQEHHAEAEANFIEAEHRIAPTDTAAWIAYVSSAREFRQPDRLPAALEKAKRSVRPNDPEGLISLAGVVQKEDALPLAEKALRSVAPEQTELYARIAIFIGQHGDRERATSMLRKAMVRANSADHIWLEKEIARLTMQVETNGSRRITLGAPIVPYQLGVWLNRELAMLEGH